MREQRARQILQALIQGLDPETGAELPPDSVLQSARVLRALLAGAAALRAFEARALRRSQLPRNVGRPWDAAEETSLVTAFEAGTALAELAEAHGRTIRAIEARLEHLGLMESRRLQPSRNAHPDATQ
jgi:hypothetical protein